MFSRIWRKGKFLNSYWWLGDLTLFEVLAGTTFYYLNCQTNQEILTKIFQEFQIPKGLLSEEGGRTEHISAACMPTLILNVSLLKIYIIFIRILPNV